MIEIDLSFKEYPSRLSGVYYTVIRANAEHIGTLINFNDEIEVQMFFN